MRDLIDELTSVRRTVGEAKSPDGEPAQAIVLRRDYRAAVDDVWDAITNPERLPRWFLPVSGEFREGGSYQLEGNAGGQILRCDPPRLLRVSWLFGPEPGFSEVEVRLSASGEDRTALELAHVAVTPPEMWSQFGPGAVGVGWDLGLLSLAVHLDGGSLGSEEAFSGSPEGRAYAHGSSDAWAAAWRAAGASEEQAAGGAKATAEFYAPS
jgi:uncharacterized protein YndB with AHSA1/START domain